VDFSSSELWLQQTKLTTGRAGDSNIWGRLLCKTLSELLTRSQATKLKTVPPPQSSHAWAGIGLDAWNLHPHID
jgi:hypothetical protein